MCCIWSCKEQSETEQQIAVIPVDLKIERFDQLLANSTVKDLPKLKSAFPFLFQKSVPDSIWEAKIQDPLQQELLSEVEAKFVNLNLVKGDLEDFYRHMSYYVPGFTEPEIITLVNEVDYRNKIVVTDSLVLIALDNYLGSDHRFYQNISKYISANMDTDNIVSDISELYGQQFVIQSSRRTFLDEMIAQGKVLYFKDKMIPFKQDAVKIGYTEAQMVWAENNESDIWSYFIEKELLYSTDSKLLGRFINPAPYSKFYLELDNESPGRIGAYMGWQIVRAYAETSEADLLSIMRTPSEELFKNSKFKPRK